MQNEIPAPQDFLRSKSSVSTITVEEAQVRIKKWLDIVGALPEFKGKDQRLTPRAILIPIADILSILEEYRHQRRHQGHQHHDKDPLGIRVYFGLVPDNVGIAPSTTYQIRGTVVAVTHDNKDFPYKHLHHDDGEDTSGSYAFDFTSPCPSTCDPSSQLFMPDNG